MILIRPATPADLPGLVQVMVQAFNLKMVVLFGRNSARTGRILQQIYAGPLNRGYDGIIVAEQDGRIVGGLVVEPMPWMQIDVERLETAIKTELGLYRQFWNHLGYSVFGHSPAPGDAYLSEICVVKDMRGHGIAQRMVGYAEEWARAHGKTDLTLLVAARNRIARHAYEKRGLGIARTEFRVLAGLLYGNYRWHYMAKSLEARVALPDEARGDTLPGRFEIG